MQHLAGKLLLGCAAFLAMTTSALAHYNTTIVHQDGSKTNIESSWNSQSAVVTNYAANGQKQSQEVGPAGGAGRWDVHKFFVKGYIRPGSKPSTQSPTFSPVGSYD